MGYDLGVEAFDHNTPITFKMRDEYLIHSDYDLVQGSKLFCLLLHGDQTSREGARRYALVFKELGFSTIVYDERSHGDNAHESVSMGKMESQDLAEIIDRVYEKFGKDITLGLQGVSMGGAIVLLSTRYSQKVSFIVSDSAYHDIGTVVKDILHKYHLPLKPLWPLINQDLQKLGDFEYDDTDVSIALKNNKIPILLLHGGKDTYVTPFQAQQIYNSLSSYKELVYFPDAVHASCITVDRAKYKDIVHKFLTNIKVIK
jgi:pimeloyl-ACP methyl ester carboxylesterase